MVKDARKCQRPSQLSGSKALKSFLGYLEGTEKAANTIKNYRLDILSFYDYLAKKSGGSHEKIQIGSLGAADLSRYHEYLKASSIKTNTRRRKLLTAHRFLRYLSKRNQLDADMPLKVATPHKLERIPFTVSQQELMGSIDSLPSETTLEHRNRALLRLLAETGCLVSEVGLLRFDDLKGLELDIPGRAQRKIPVSAKLKKEFELLAERQKSAPDHFVFLGYNRHGPLSESMSPRGIEMLVRFYSSKYFEKISGKLGQPLTPRTFRHSAVLAWFQAGLPQAEVQRRLGLKTAYAFRTFAPLLEKT